MMKLYKFLSITIVYLFITSCVRTPKEQFYTSPTGCHSYNYNFIEDDKLWQALDSGWISQEVFNLICDLEIKENTYGKAIKKAQSLLDSVSWRQDNLKFPFSLPNNCTQEQLLSFLKYECGDYTEYHTTDTYYGKGVWDTLLVRYKDSGFRKGENDYEDLKYCIYNDTVVNIQFNIKESLRESLINKYGYSLVATIAKDEYIDKTYYHHIWLNENFILKITESEYYYSSLYRKEKEPIITTSFTYVNRQVLSSYRKASRDAKLQHMEQVRIKQIQDSIAEIRKLEAARQQAIQDSISNVQDKQKLLLEL